MILTNAAGASTQFTQGTLVVIGIVLICGANPLPARTMSDLARFPDMSTAYTAISRMASAKETAQHRMYAAGGAARRPSTTPAEIRYLRTIGADLVGCPRVQSAARHSGTACGNSCVTNAAAGILDQPLDHKEVLETAERVKGQFIGLLKALIPRIAETIS
jgi:purine-nucleoside phosphorylase